MAWPCGQGGSGRSVSAMAACAAGSIGASRIVRRSSFVVRRPSARRPENCLAVVLFHDPRKRWRSRAGTEATHESARPARPQRASDDPRLLWPDRQVDSASTHVTAAGSSTSTVPRRRGAALRRRPEGARNSPSSSKPGRPIDPRKRFSWPLYVAGPRARLGCPVVLVVLTLDHEVARWCR
ncbi:MAG: hypothetical protein R3A79_00045 [Nannocystaceae bacterium]